MECTDADMQEILNHLSEKNREIVMTVAKSLKIAQDVAQKACRTNKARASEAISKTT